MMLKLSLEYMALVFMAIAGVLQLAAMYGGLTKLLFFRAKALTWILAAVLVLFPLALLFTWNYRNATGIVQGAEQAGLFMVSLVLALVVTLVLSSFLNSARVNPPPAHKEGLEALRDVTYFRAFERKSERKSR